MPVLFRPFQSQIASKISGKKLYYPSVVTTGTVTINQLADEIAKLSSLSAGDVKNSINNLVTVMTQHLQASEIVNIDGFGTFRIAMKSAGNGVETADEVSASQANLLVRFRPSSTRNSNGTIATRSLLTGCKFSRFDKLSSTLTLNLGSDDTAGSDTANGDTGNGDQANDNKDGEQDGNIIPDDPTA